MCYIGRCLLSGKTDRGGLTVVWPRTMDCNIGYYDVFDESQFSDIELNVIELNMEDNVAASVEKSIPEYLSKKQFVKVLSEIRKRIWLKVVMNFVEYYPPKEVGWSGTPYLNYTMECWKKVKNHLHQEDKLFVHAYCGIIVGEERENVDYSVIKFKEEYWEKVRLILSGNNHWVGMHIRRTDHTVAIKGSSTNAFIKKIEEILSQEENLKLFLATDDIIEERQLKARYGDTIITQTNKEWGRDSMEGMKAGIIDCLCLSCCDYILGSYASVFSSFSAAYGKKELIICKDEENG